MLIIRNLNLISVQSWTYLLRKESRLHPQSKVLFRCLATTDLCVGIIAGPPKVCYFVALATL